ncbi:MAG: LapA family protein [Bacteroidetes bacterium]|nr:LapA family protein [Bacteroidota bacterium]
MRIKTMIIIIITVLLTVVIMQNTEHVNFDFLFFTFRVSKLLMLLIVALVAFLIGVLVGRPGKPKYIPGQVEDFDPNKKKLDTLSDEDREYIS